MQKPKGNLHPSHPTGETDVLAKTFIIFHCDKDNCWIVSVLNGDIALGVAECPDEHTAHVVLDALRLREEQRGD